MVSKSRDAAFLRASVGEDEAFMSTSVLSASERTRYARHLVLPDVGPKGQERLRSAKVVVVGAGGLGSPAAMYLAAAGVGVLGLVDGDAVELSNLQRQILHGTQGVGAPKTRSGAERIRDLNPHVSVARHPVRLDSQNALDILAEYDVVLDGTDNFPARYLVNDACVILGLPCVYGAIHQWEGQLSVFGGRLAGGQAGPCYRCLFRDPPPAGTIPNCAEAGVFGALPGVIGAGQAIEALKLLLGVGEPLVGRLKIFDALRFNWRELEIARDPDCPVCGDQAGTPRLIDYELFCGGAPSEEEERCPEISVRELRRAVRGREAPRLIDVRRREEWDEGNLKEWGAVLIPLDALESRLDEIPKDQPVAVHCRTGVRSAFAVRLLISRGYANARNVRGGIEAVWSLEAEESAGPEG